MKRTIITTLLATSGAAYACGGKPCPTPSPATSPPTSVAPLQSESASSSTSQAAAQAGAQGIGLGVGSGGDATGTGGTGTASLADNSTSRALALSLFVPPPPFMPPMAQVQCASANVRQESVSGWLILGGGSKATGETDSSDCTLLNIRNAMVKECKYLSAKQVEDLLVQKYLPKFQPNGSAYTKSVDDPGFVDYTPTQCAVLMSPPPPQPLVAIEKLMPPDLRWPKMPPPVRKPPKTSDKNPCKDVCKRPVGLI